VEEEWGLFKSIKNTLIRKKEEITQDEEIGEILSYETIKNIHDFIKSSSSL
jgi:hypothetical protein